ncbi:Vegetative incompatibility protein HET-E-1 [Lachnellula hyalina]|uniref:Vegetative incompatibility protein HET-E-1 n=1 Tax=Lachnellula hyalina TaxID=1316788 RepID=A0A8H8R747_9HELO|nr:Vegetative incompatibility protein HET-E-1 [Lachnellula hyalina]TVY29236.1 Vegetative incompatibility protein HET-E-1 [Lachnellula hyalina]
MWLVNIETHRLEEFSGSEIPKYAILSHTWEEEEVTFQEIHRRSALSKKGYAKIKETCIRAHRHGLHYAWIDTCCIDKRSSTELAESINSMFQWYQNAAICYVYLSDLPSGAHAEDGLAECRWFTRGWTLQELIAPREVCFYDQQWGFFGTKRDLSEKISSITSIDMKVLMGVCQANYYSVATRMSWAAHRETKRIEDLAYSLLGIFDVHMPLMYGEGSGSFRRLQEAIIQRNNDMTIFAWDYEQGQEQTGSMGLFSSSPSGFARSKACQYNRGEIDPVFSMTNKGLRFDRFACLYKRIQDDDGGIESTRYSIPLGVDRGETDAIHYFMQLRKVGPGVFLRDGKLLIDNGSLGHGPANRLPTLDFYIHADTQEAHVLESSRRHKAVHFPRHDQIRVQGVLPESHWDDSKNRFFTEFADDNLILATSCLVKLETSQAHVVVCINSSTEVPSCRIFNAEKYQKQLSWLLRHQRFGHNVTWHDVEAELPRLLDFTDKMTVFAKGYKSTISVLLEKKVRIATAVPNSTSELHAKETTQGTGIATGTCDNDKFVPPTERNEASSRDDYEEADEEKYKDGYEKGGESHYEAKSTDIERPEIEDPNEAAA